MCWHRASTRLSCCRGARGGGRRVSLRRRARDPRAPRPRARRGGRPAAHPVKRCMTIGAPAGRSEASFVSVSVASHAGKLRTSRMLSTGGRARARRAPDMPPPPRVTLPAASPRAPRAGCPAAPPTLPRPRSTQHAPSAAGTARNTLLSSDLRRQPHPSLPPTSSRRTPALAHSYSHRNKTLLSFFQIQKSQENRRLLVKKINTPLWYFNKSIPYVKQARVIFSISK